MKRGILYGIGTYFMVGAIWLLTQPATRLHLMEGHEATIWFELVVVVIAIVAFYTATFLPARRSWADAWLGGFLGFFGTMGVLFVAVILIGGLTELLSR